MSYHLITLDAECFPETSGEQGGDIQASNLNSDELRLIDTFMVEEQLLVNKSQTTFSKSTALPPVLSC